MAYNASEGHLRRDGSRGRQDGGTRTRKVGPHTGLDRAGRLSTTGAKDHVCSCLSFLFLCSNTKFLRVFDEHEKIMPI